MSFSNCKKFVLLLTIISISHIPTSTNSTPANNQSNILENLLEEVFILPLKIDRIVERLALLVNTDQMRTKNKRVAIGILRDIRRILNSTLKGQTTINTIQDPELQAQITLALLHLCDSLSTYLTHSHFTFTLHTHASHTPHSLPNLTHSHTSLHTHTPCSQLTHSTVHTHASHTRVTPTPYTPTPYTHTTVHTHTTFTLYTLNHTHIPYTLTPPTHHTSYTTLTSYTLMHHIHTLHTQAPHFTFTRHTHSLHTQSYTQLIHSHCTHT